MCDWRVRHSFTCATVCCPALACYSEVMWSAGCLRLNVTSQRLIIEPVQHLLVLFRWHHLLGRDIHSAPHGHQQESMQGVRAEGGKIAIVAGPVVVHTGGAPYLASLIRSGYVQVLLSGNALAVHDIEFAMFGTSLGVNLETGRSVEGGHHHHMRAINAVRRAGGFSQAVEQDIVKSGILYECQRHGIEYVLAGSIRDDGPLPETIMDLVEAQDRYAVSLKGVTLVLMLASMLHGIGVGNMLPSAVRVVCIDINPAVVTKLGDRGSSQTVGIVTDTGLFLRQLVEQLGA